MDIYLERYTNLKAISILMLIHIFTQGILSPDYVRKLYRCRQYGCRLSFELIGETHYSVSIFNAYIILLYFGELTLRPQFNKTIHLEHYSYESIVTCYRCLKMVPEECLALPVTEKEEVIVKEAMKYIELYIKGHCGL